MPKVTVAMPLYNDELYVSEAVRSILEQTFTDFELLVINDGCTDKSAEIVAGFRDKRIRLEDNGANCGRAYSRNRALDLASGEYLAWMDADDISHPERLACQVAFLDQNLDFSLCSTPMELFNNKSGVIGQILSADEIIAQTIFSPVAFNGPTCLRLEKVKNFGLSFDIRLKRAEDFGFMADLFLGKQEKASIIPRPLYKCRYFDRPANRTFHTQAVRDHVFPALRLPQNDEMASLHTDLILDYPTRIITKYGFSTLLSWLDTVYQHGKILGSDIQNCLLRYLCDLLKHLVSPSYHEQLFRLWNETAMSKALPRATLASRLGLHR